ncbi:MAG: PD-(D/E)XK nuclease family protein [Nitrososphaerales archaeon]|jgi:CRISPR/Cas system-associated exonuclease Cas4 (RecB family)
MEGIPEGRAPYRHDLPFVGASTLAQQFYCEAKVENEYRLGEVPTEGKDVGTDLHNEIFAMEPVKRDDLIKQIEESPSLTASFGLYAQIGDLRVAGVPDAVIFEKGTPRWVVELKTTRGDPSRLWRDQAIQVKVYGALLEHMGFDCSNLTLALIRMKQRALAPPERESLLLLVKDALARERTAQLEAKYGMKFFLLPHVRTEAEDAVTWAQDYWLKRREAIPTTVEGKCRSCEFNDVCAFSLFKPQR